MVSGPILLEQLTEQASAELFVYLDTLGVIRGVAIVVDGIVPCSLLPMRRSSPSASMHLGNISIKHIRVSMKTVGRASDFRRLAQSCYTKEQEHFPVDIAAAALSLHYQGFPELNKPKTG